MSLSLRAPRQLCLPMLGMLLAFSTHGHAHAAGVTWDGVHDRNLATWEFQVSPYTYHFDKEPEHVNVLLAGITKIREDGWLAGGAYFRNSFGQPCAYGFVGHKYVEPWGIRDVYWTWTAGVIYGYKEPYEDKVPLNANGFSPAFVPSVGYQITPRVALQLSLLGTSGLMFNLTFDVGRAQK